MKYKAVVRYDNGQVEYREEVLEFDGSLDELLRHAHIVSAEVFVEDKKETKTEKK